MELDKASLAKRFVNLPAEKQVLFLELLGKQGIDFAQLPIVPREQSGGMLSYAQRRLWFLWQFDRQSTAYHIPATLRLKGDLDIEALQHSFDVLVERHVSLRTVFSGKADGSAEQIVQAAQPAPVEYIDLRLSHAIETDAAMHLQRLSTTPFDLELGPLMRVGIVHIADDEYILSVVMHHIISDGWSMQVIVNEFVQIYRAHLEGTSIHLPILPIAYTDYAVWQRNWLDAGEGERQLAWWKERLSAEQPVLQLPTDYPRQAVARYHAAHHRFTLPDLLSRQLAVAARAQNATLFMVLLAGFQALLHRYTGQTNIRVGTPLANRHRDEVEHLIGLFVNTQIMNNRIDSTSTLQQISSNANDMVQHAQSYQDLPFEQLVEALQPERSLSHNPLFQVMHNHQREYDHLLQLPKLKVSPYALGGQTAQFEFMLSTSERQDGGVNVDMIYAEELFEPETIRRMGGHYVKLLQAIAEDAEQTVGEVVLLDESEQRQLDTWSRNETRYGSDVLVHQLFEQQAQAQPDAVALIFGDAQLSYGALNTRANRLAHHLIHLGIGPESRVGIAVERSLEMVIGLLAILKAGAAYVPLDPEYPQDRLAYMMQDSGIDLLLTQSPLIVGLPIAAGLNTVLLDQLALDQPMLTADSPAYAPASNPDTPLHPDQLAYVIYTSGSTGRPKGVANSHLSLHNRLQWMQDAYRLGAGDTVLQKTPFSFDVSVWEFFWPLMTGARLALAQPGDHREPALLVDLIMHHNVTTLHFVPSMLQAFLAHKGIESCRSIRHIVCSGEALAAQSQREVFKRLPWVQLHNLYGPTEAAIDVTHWTCSATDMRASVPIGRPIANTTTRILDSELNPVAVGLAGELYLGGIGLARGYLARAGLTAERFVADPTGTDGGRLYRTGDLARWSNDGQIEYLGRLDHQVKIRGFRIELGEIEAQLLACPGIGEAVVVAQQGPGGSRLVAYVSVDASPEQQNLTRALREQLGQVLPDYMVPATIVLLDHLPLNANGKVDRKALPAPDTLQEREYQAPQSDTETVIAGIWADVLGLDNIGRHDNFFELGGDSILSLQIVSRLKQAGFKVSPRQLFERQTVAALATVAESAHSEMAYPQEAASGNVPLLPIQAEFFAMEIPERHHWNQSVLLRSTQLLNAVALEKALHALIAHHDALRLRFHQQANGQWMQHYAEAETGELLWQSAASNAEEVTAACDAAQASLNIEQGPLLRAVTIQHADGSGRLLLVIHHLVVDGVSWRILLEDLQSSYLQALAGIAPQLPSRTSSYQAWAQRLQDYTLTHAEELAWWQAQVGKDIEIGAGIEAESKAAGLAPDKVIGSPQADYTSLKLDRETTQALLKEAPAAYRTQVNDLLLTALGRAFSTWAGQAEVLIDLEGHGREDLYEELDLTRTVGWFTSVFPVRIDASGELGVALKRVKETLRSVPRRGLGFGIFKHHGTNGQRESISALPQARMLFNYLGQFDSSFQQDASWIPATESPGREMGDGVQRMHEFSVNCQVYEGQLTLSINFDSAHYKRSAIEALIADYLSEITQLVAHCTSGAFGVTPSDFPLAGTTQVVLDNLPLPVAMLEDLYPLAPMQSGMLFHSLFDQSSGVYLNQLRADMEHFDMRRFSAAWQHMFRQHEVLRSGFLCAYDINLQWVARDIKLPISEYDWRGQPQQAQVLDMQAQADLAQGFDLAQPPLTRLTVIRTGGERYHLIWTIHHVLLDGWSVSQLMSEVLLHYAGQAPAMRQGRYRDYIGWLAERDALIAETYWHQLLTPLVEPVRLENAFPKTFSDIAQNGNSRYETVLDCTLRMQMERFCKREHLTINTVVQAAWALLLSRYTRQHIVTFGATTAGRPPDLAGAEHLIGLFINTLPVIAHVHPETAIIDLLRTLQAQNVASREYEYTPLYDIQRWANLSGHALFDSILVFENYPIDAALKQASLAGISFSNVSHHEETNYPLTVAVTQMDTLRIQYNFDLSSFCTDDIAGIAAHMASLLNALTDSSREHLGDIPWLTATEHQQLLAWGQSTALWDKVGVHQLVERQTIKHPDAIALIFGGRELSYDKINRQSNQLAHHLVAAGVTVESRVGIALERSMHMIVAMLAVLKAGGAYVPLDPDYPQQRLSFMLQDSGVSLLLTQSHIASVQAGIESQGIELPRIDLDRIDTTALPDHNLNLPIHLQQMAYVIYTSGSTGRPKGVAVNHGPLAMHIQTIGELYGMTPQDRELQFASINFDGAHERWLVPLAFGSALMPRDNELWSVERTCDEIKRHGITIACFTPSYLHQLAELMGEQAAALPIRSYTVGGEAMPRTSFDLVQRVLKPPRIINGYGPTETVITPAISRAYPDTRFDSAYMPIGKPVGEREAYVLGGDMTLLPLGIAGELYLGGGLARGYLNRPELTASAFVANPFANDGSRLYRTGDLVVWRQDGELEYLGRVDHQVKIRGFRIELGEIEAQLLLQANVSAVVVTTLPGHHGVRLVAYVASDSKEHAVFAAALRAALAASLPDYMIPSTIIVLDKLPLNANGKVDRAALPIPALGDSEQYVAPETDLEKTLASIWSEVLGVMQIGRHDNFFAAGGDSILSLRVVARASKQGVNITPKQMFENQVLQTLAQAILALGGARIDAIPVLPQQGAAELSYAQNRLWFMWQFDGTSTAYHIPAALKLKGQLDHAALQHSFDTLIARHASLRTIFTGVADGSAEQRIQAVHAANIELTDLGSVSDADRDIQVKATIRHLNGTPFDLTQGPLMRIGLIRLAEDEHILVVVLHHIISDGWSMQVIVNEFSQLYRAHAEGRVAELAALPIQYTDYAAWQRNWLEAGERDRQLAWWKDQLGEEHPVLQLSADYPRQAIGHYTAGGHSFVLPPDLVTRLKQYAQEQGATLFMVLLAGFQALLYRYTGQTDIRVGSPIANRHRVETEGIVGFFVNTQVLNSRMHSRTLLSDVVQQARNIALGAQAHQDLPFEQLVEALQPERSLSHNPLFQVMYNHLREDYRALEQLPGLTLESQSLGDQNAQFELGLDTTEFGNGELHANLNYARELFEPETIRRMGGHYVKLLQAIAEDAEQTVGEVVLLDESEQRQLDTWSRNETRYGSDVLVHQLFEQQAQAQPDAVALIFGDAQLSYGALNTRANRLAHHLIHLGIGPESRVGIAVERSLEMVIGLLAILKAGAAYVPLDPEYPQDRLAYMMQDSGIDLLLTQTRLAERLAPAPGLPTVWLDSLESWMPAGNDVSAGLNPDVRLHPEQLAYVIYTSGSTGRPKGAQLQHRNVVRLLAATEQWFHFGPQDVWTLFHSYAFDFSVWEMFGALCTGGRLVIVPYMVSRSPEEFLQVLQQQKVTVLNQTPSAFRQLLQLPQLYQQGFALRTVIFGGEALESESLRPWLDHFGDEAVELINMYGITETTVHVTYRRITRADLNGQRSPIGLQIPDLGLYVLDSHLNLCPIGVPGELHVAGAGLARGYLNRPGLTAERFIANPFNADAQGDGRLYRSGDLVRWRHDGELEYLGRIDHQVKIRGFRIELGEIEAQLLAYPGIREAVVVTQQSLSGVKLIAYVAANVVLQEAIVTNELREHLLQRLPDYMIPAAIMVLETLPLNANGKIDRKALPEPEFSSDRPYEAPVSKMEIALATIWAEVLGIKKIGLHDNFFELGGNSLAVLQVRARIQSVMQINLPVRDLFETQELTSFAARIADSRSMVSNDDLLELDAFIDLLENV